MDDLEKNEDMEEINDDNGFYQLAAERYQKKLAECAELPEKSSFGTKSNTKAKRKRIEGTVLTVGSGESSMVAGLIFTNAWHIKEFLKGEEEIDGK